MALAIAESDDATLNVAEKAFLTAVFVCRGIRGPPSHQELRDALELMSSYVQQVEDNPPGDAAAEHDGYAGYELSEMSDDERVMVAAAVFVRFGVTKPSGSQWKGAYLELFGSRPAVYSNGELEPGSGYVPLTGRLLAPPARH